MYTTTDYGITYLFHDRRARASMGGPTFSAFGVLLQRNALYKFTVIKLLSLRHASVEWVMGRYLTLDTVLRDRRHK